MEIVDIKAYHTEIPLNEPGLRTSPDRVRKRYSGHTVVKVFTDEGIVGIGGQNTRWAGFVRFIDERMKPYLLDRLVDPFFIEKFARDQRLAAPSGIWPRPNCVEMALWDIVGKKAGLPVYKLLGAYRDKIKVYISQMEEWPRLTPTEYADLMVSLRERGYRAVKMHIHDPDWRKDLERVTAVRDALGDDMDIMVDAEIEGRSGPGTVFPYSVCLKMGRALEKMDVIWYEGVLSHMMYPELTKKLADELDIPIAGGGQFYGWYQFMKILDIVDIVQPDAQYCGGILEAKKISFLAETRGKECVFHSGYGPGLGITADLHAACASPINKWFEFGFHEPSYPVAVRDYYLTKPQDIDKDGYLHVPNGPGLGVEINEKALEECTVEKSKGA